MNDLAPGVEPEVAAAMADARATVPDWRGWSMSLRPQPDRTWRAALVRGTPNGPDELELPANFTNPATACRALVELICEMMALHDDPAGRAKDVAAMRARIRYAPPATDEQWAAMRAFWRSLSGSNVSDPERT